MYSNKKLKIAFVVKGGCLIYIAVSKNPKESISFLKKQLETLHTTLVSIATKNFVEMLMQNSSYDVMGDPSIYR